MKYRELATAHNLVPEIFSSLRNTLNKQSNLSIPVVGIDKLLFYIISAAILTHKNEVRLTINRFYFPESCPESCEQLQLVTSTLAQQINSVNGLGILG